MTRRSRIWLMILACLGGLLLLLVVSAIVILQTDWFKNYVKEKIVAVTEESTGGKVTIGAFSFDWTQLRASINDFVIHGTEPAGSAPLFQAHSIVLELKLFSGLKKAVDLNYLGVKNTSVNLMVFPDGKTNIPTPKVAQKPSNKSGLETVVDLAVNQFKIENGYVQFAQQKTAFGAQGHNLRTQLFYNAATPGYRGSLAISPLVLSAKGKTPLHANVSLPVVIGKDSIQLSHAKITTPQSNLSVDGSLEHLADPAISAHITAHIALAEVNQVAAIDLHPNAKGAPSVADADIAIHSDGRTMNVQNAKVTLGSSTITASGPLRGGQPGSSLQFDVKLAVSELSNLLDLASHSAGEVELAGNATMPSSSDYHVNGTLAARNISFQQGQTTLRDINFTSRVEADPQKVQLANMRLAAVGGEVTGNLRVEQFERLALNAELRNFDLQRVTREATHKQIGYAGVLSGPVKVQDNLKAKGTTGISAEAHLSIAPGARGVPVSSRLNATYNGAAETVDLARSYIALPHSRLDLTGTLGKRIDLQLQSRNLNDFLPAAAFASSGKPMTELPITLQNGTAVLNARVTGSFSAPQISGNAELTRFSAEQRRFDRLSADFAASPSGAEVKNGTLVRNSLNGKFSASVGLKKWSPTPRSPLSASLTMQNADLADIMALAGQKPDTATGKLAADAQVSGTVGNPQGGANLSVENGTIYGEPFDALNVNATFADQVAELRRAEFVDGPSHVDLHARYVHPRDSFSTGHVQAELSSNEWALSRLKSIQTRHPGLAGTVQLNATTEADVQSVAGKSAIAVRSINGNLAAHDLRDKRQSFGNLTADAQTTGNTVNYKLASNFTGSSIQANGRTELRADYPTTADLSVSNLQLEKVLQVAGKDDLPVRGNAGMVAHLQGTLDRPDANVQLTLTNANLYDEPINRLAAQLNYTNQLVDLPSLEINLPAGQMKFSGSFAHPANNFNTGELKARINGPDLQLARIVNLQKTQPGLSGAVHISADAAANLRPQAGTVKVLLTKLDSDIGASALTMNKQSFGDVRLVSQTRGSDLSFRLDSDFAQSAIHGKGNVQLAGSYPAKANVTFNNIRYVNLRPFLSSELTARPALDGEVAGEITVDGPIEKPESLNAQLSLSKLAFSAPPRGMATNSGRTVAIQNDGPIVVDLNRSVVRVQSAHLTGRSTDIKLGGTAALTNTRALDLHVDANTDLSLLQDLDRDVYSSGNVVLTAVVHGELSKPVVNGKVELKDASINVTQSPNGISKANGVILLNGTSATVQNLTGESGGGKVSVAGFAGLTGTTVRYALRTKAEHVRTRYSGASIVSSAALTLNGTTDHSILSGNVTIERLGFNSQSDFGSMLSSSATPPLTPSAPSGPVAGMRLDIRVRTAPDVRFQTSIAQSLQGIADLNVQGTLANPGLTGRVNITEGRLVFFGNQYTVNRGSVSFYNPLKIAPVLDVDLETTVKGVDVILGVAGPIENMKLSYRSDPPLRFDEIVALLATGKVPASDPTIAAHQEVQPQQSLTQMGESAIVSQAVAAPLASRIQRVFGVNQIKIDPTFTSGSALAASAHHPATTDIWQHHFHLHDRSDPDKLPDPAGGVGSLASSIRNSNAR